MAPTLTTWCQAEHVSAVLGTDSGAHRTHAHLSVSVCVCVWGGGGGQNLNVKPAYFDCDQAHRFLSESTALLLHSAA
jgi:hypothetical protein